MATTVAKFRLDRYETTLHKRRIDPKGPWEPPNTEKVEMRTLIFGPVYGNGDPNHENTKFWEATPFGEIKLGTVNPEAWKNFDIGKEYLVKFEEAEIQPD